MCIYTYINVYIYCILKLFLSTDTSVAGEIVFAHPSNGQSETAVEDKSETVVEDKSETAVQDKSETAVQDKSETAVEDKSETAVEDKSETAVEDMVAKTDYEESQGKACICIHIRI
jgi:hypothetical protein